jgi:hypothetical protein
MRTPRASSSRAESPDTGTARVTAINSAPEPHRLRFVDEADLCDESGALGAYTTEECISTRPMIFRTPRSRLDILRPLHMRWVGCVASPGGLAARGGAGASLYRVTCILRSKECPTRTFKESRSEEELAKLRAEQQALALNVTRTMLATQNNVTQVCTRSRPCLQSCCTGATCGRLLV